MSSNVQVYTAQRSWDRSEWPYDMEPDTISTLNDVLPRGYDYVLFVHEGELGVELRYYEGEADAGTIRSVTK